MPYQIRRAAVIGSGTMGGAIAAHLANVGIPVDLLDIVPFELTPEEQDKGLTMDDPAVRNRIVNKGWEAVLKSRPAALYTKANADLVRLGNLDDHFDRLAEADWICEVIIENLDIKRSLMKRLETVRKPDAIVATNTSGIPLKDIAEELSEGFRQHFIGMHFFNPPRYLKLLEIIPHQDTLPEVIEAMIAFGENELGKGAVLCKDTPNFIANRIFSAVGSHDFGYAVENGYSIEEVDNLTGPLLGRPKTGTFRLLDLVGLDVMAHVNTNLYEAIPHDESREMLADPKVKAIMEQMLEKGWLGNKTNAGFYKKTMVDGQREFWTVDFETMTHTAPEKVRFDSVGEFRKLEPLGARIKAMVEADDRAGEYVRHAMYNLLSYSANRIPEIADDVAAIDNAIKWGFAHEMGPFEVWDALGVAESIEKMEAAGYSVADWVKDMLDQGMPTFYQYEDGLVSGYYHYEEKGYVPLPDKPREIRVNVLKSTHGVVAENDDVSLVDMGDGVALFEVHTKANTLTMDILDFGHRVIDEYMAGFDALVIGNDGGRFSAGANLDITVLNKLAAEQGKTPVELAEEVLFRRGQDMMMGFRYLDKPVVAAPFQLTLGGGAELSMAADRIVAHAELYMGLVEVGVGLVPGWGGCKELLRRVVNPVMEVRDADPLPPLTQVFEQVGLAKVATSAAEAREMGFLTKCDRIVVNQDQLLAEAKREARHMADAGYRPPKPAKIYAAGRDLLSAMQTQIYMLEDAGYATGHDAFIANKVAWILSGGDLSAPTWVDEQYILDLEREAITALIQHPKTIERIFHMLSTGKPLRN